MNDDRLDGKHILVTGGARGTCRGIATCAARAGADNTILDIDLDDVEATEEQVRAENVSVNVQQADVTDPADVENVVTEAMDAIGPIDGLVNNAGV